MIRMQFLKPGGWKRAGLLGVLILVSLPAEAGFPARRRARVVAPTAYTGGGAVYPGLGTFYPDPYIIVRGNAPVGGGYTAFGRAGDATLALYGPLSPLRATAAPVVTYSRGYDGVVRANVGVGFSYPNLPELSPVVYPTRANVFDGFRESGTPPWWDAAHNWIDQN